jgi:hypothetical protein
MMGMNNLLKYKLIGEIVALAVIVNEKTPATVFIDFSGHVEWIDITIHRNGWKENQRAEISETIHVNKDRDEITSKGRIEQLKKIKSILSGICIKGKIDLSVLPYEIETIKIKNYSLTEGGLQ